VHHAGDAFPFDAKPKATKPTLNTVLKSCVEEAYDGSVISRFLIKKGTGRLFATATRKGERRAESCSAVNTLQI
jgi:hypothetical protein